MVEGYARHLMRWHADGDGRVNQADIDDRFPKDYLFRAVSITHDMLTPPPAGWNLAAARELFARNYEKTKVAALANPDDAPYPDQWGAFRMVVASNNWWKQWFEDTTPMIDHLAHYRGYASLHFGGIDSQSDGARQLAFAKDRIKTGIFAKAPRLVFHKGRGHSLRTGEPAAGPMDAEAKACLVNEIKDALLP
jgi:hypothetical protein